MDRDKDLYYPLIRENIDFFLTKQAERYDKEDVAVLEIGPSDINKNALDYFQYADIDFMDINPDSAFDDASVYIADLCKVMEDECDGGPDWGVSLTVCNEYDVILCMEVLEHCESLDQAVAGLAFMIKPGGVVLYSSVWSFRLHNPRPDRYRISEDGIKALFSKGWEILEINPLYSPHPDGRITELSPLGYTSVIKKL